jgi:site-specific recombinase XerD
LKRLSIERRRPYQVLSEPEWEAFLTAARLPMDAAPHATEKQPKPTPDDSDGGEAEQAASRERSPWGIPRSMRARARAELAEQGRDDCARPRDGEPDETAVSQKLPHSRAGLTGQRTAQRDHALIALALATGLRAIELASLDVGDLSREWHAGREEWWLVLPDKKTKGQRGGRVLPLDGELITILMDYVEATGRRWERPRDRATPLFLSGSQAPAAHPRKKATVGEAGSAERERAARLSPHSIRRIVDRVETQWLALRAGQDGEQDGAEGVTGETRQISPHALRHSTAIALLEGNAAIGRPPASVEHVRGWLGHFDIRTTQGYLAHLEGRKHRRPFTLSPGRAQREELPTSGERAQRPESERDA